MATAADKKFDKSIEALRQLIQAEATPFPKDRKLQKERIARAGRDMEYFSRTYFPHYFTKPSSKLHKYFFKRFKEMIFRAVETGEGDREADAAPRGNAKSTIGTFSLPLWCAAYKRRRFIVIVSETMAQSEDFLSFIKAELETNERLRQDFPDLCGEGPVWRANTIITRNGIKMRGVGAGQKLRGMRHGSLRPDLVIIDDLENDESVESPEQRSKLSRWFFRALTKIGAKYTVYIVVGTVLHWDSLLVNLLDMPGWKGMKFKSVLSWASNTKLWEQWEAIFADVSAGKAEAEAAADAFHAANEEAMLEGAEVLWPEVEDYYYLMKMRVAEGPANFESEKQNEPVNPEDAVFLEEWFTFYDDDEVDLSGLKHAGACDPSLGKKRKRGDTSAILGGRIKNNIVYLTVADIERRHPDKIIDDTLEHHARDTFDEFAVEATQFQEYFKDNVEKEAHRRGLTLNVKGVDPTKDKDLRIMRLQPWIKNGWIRFLRHGMAELLRQLKYYRPGGKTLDDGPDALEMLLTLLESGMVKAAAVSEEPGKNDYHAERPRGALGRRFGRRRVA